MVLFVNLLGKGLTQEIIGDGGPILWAPVLLELSVVRGKNDTVATSKKVGGVEGFQGNSS